MDLCFNKSKEALYILMNKDSLPMFSSVQNDKPMLFSFFSLYLCYITYTQMYTFLAFNHFQFLAVHPIRFCFVFYANSLYISLTPSKSSSPLTQVPTQSKSLELRTLHCKETGRRWLSIRRVTGWLLRYNGFRANTVQLKPNSRLLSTTNL